MIKALLALPLMGFALIAAKPAAPVAPPSVIAVPAAVAADPTNRWTLDLSTGGKVVIQLRPDIAPQTVQRIKLLTAQGFYNGLKFHRVIPGFMAQGGDPQGTGEGGSPLPDLKAEFNALPHLRGVTSMARAESPDSANSQFFIMLAPTFKLDGKYTVWGKVVSGMEHIDAIKKGDERNNGAISGTPDKVVSMSVAAPT